MKKYTLTSLIVVACALLFLPALAQQARQLNWDDLIPAHLLAGDPLEKLSPDQKDMVYWVINMLQTLPKRGPQTEEDYKQIDELMPSLRKAGIDIVKVQAKIKEIQDLDCERTRRRVGPHARLFAAAGCFQCQGN
jgi:hypothetical protein